MLATIQQLQTKITDEIPRQKHWMVVSYSVCSLRNYSVNKFSIYLLQFYTMSQLTPEQKDIHDRTHKCYAELLEMEKEYLELQKKYNEKKREYEQYLFQLEQSNLS